METPLRDGSQTKPVAVTESISIPITTTSPLDADITNPIGQDIKDNSVSVTIASDQDPIPITTPETITVNELGDFGFNASRGSIPGINVTGITGNIPSIDTSDGQVDITNLPSKIIPFLSVAENINVVSDDVDDTLAGSGAQVVLIPGQDTAGLEISELVFMNGLTDVLTTNLFSFISNPVVVQVGVTGYNEGTITFTSDTSVTLLAQIDPMESSATSSVYRVPSNKFGYIVNVIYSLGGTGGGTRQAVGRVKFRFPGAGFVPDIPTTLSTTGTTTIDLPLRFPPQLPPGTDIINEVPSVTANGTQFAAVMQIIEELITP